MPQQPQPQYGSAPQYADQASYGGQPQFGGQVPPGGGYGGYVPPEYQKNGFSIAGFVLCFLPLLGIIFSILGLSKSGKVGGKGRGLSIAGLVLSIAFIGGYAAIGVAVSKSTALDPGCTSAESSFNSIKDKVQADTNKLSGDSGDQTALQADLSAFTSDVQTMKTDLDNALAQAQHQSVKDKIQAMDTDVTTVLSGLKAIQNGDTSQLNAFEAAAGRLESDGNAIDNICSSL